jgi:ABC-type uncharacterized transport system substrate-binding protein
MSIGGKRPLYLISKPATQPVPMHPQPGYAENQMDRLPALAADLVRGRVAVILAAGHSAALAAKAATTTIPIVFSSGGDPVAGGLSPALTGPATTFSTVSAKSGHSQSRT